MFSEYIWNQNIFGIRSKVDIIENNRWCCLEDMTEKEQAILDDCDSVALYQYSLPLAGMEDLIGRIRNRIEKSTKFELGR